jgi:tRNA(Ile2) C34 agmatinyltransferase TiaS
MIARRVGSESAAKTRSRFKLTIELTNGAVQRPRQARRHISSP